VRDDARRNEALGREVFGALAVKGGEAVAQTDIAVQPGETGKALQWGTYVHRDHRGHRLGLLLKIDMMHWLAEAEPQLKIIQTWNNVDNAFMINVNEALGYRLSRIFNMYELRLDRPK